MLVKRLAKDRQKFDREQSIDPSKMLIKSLKKRLAKDGKKLATTSTTNSPHKLFIDLLKPNFKTFTARS